MDLDLDTVPMGRTGLEVSEIAFGTWRFGRETAAGNLEISRERGHDLLDTYEAAGGRFIDTANVYGGGVSEEWIGEWMEERNRDEFVIASKIFGSTREDDPNAGGLNRKHVRNQIDVMLDRLGTDYLDVLYIHRWDESTAARELMRTLNSLVEDGKVHYLGASTGRPNGWRIARANEIARQHGWVPFTVTQPRYSLVNREIEAEYMELCRERDIGIAPWSPLAQGFLTGKYERDADMPDDSTASDSDRWEENYLTETNFDVLDEVRDVAEEVGATEAQVALAYQLHHADVTAPIVGARTTDQLEENLRAATVSLSDEQFERLEASKADPYADI
ncbi:Predicted oxidoreductase [Halovenus aranensis]|uniref:Predicted oxidoreductase n=1 Tax=Halovenus aranensis TaxID=890420 RepID=A0A1G8RZ30_9EURY|nr:aldo/keto reductase [Halovenus aranensis]SDJ22228.1 Predicted oxidoreductase [Halovenus aranensis]